MSSFQFLQKTQQFVLMGETNWGKIQLFHCKDFKCDEEKNCSSLWCFTINWKYSVNIWSSSAKWVDLINVFPTQILLKWLTSFAFIFNKKANILARTIANHEYSSTLVFIQPNKIYYFILFEPQVLLLKAITRKFFLSD